MRGYRVEALDAGGEFRPVGVEYDLASREQLEAVGARHEDGVLARVVDVRDLDALRAAAVEAVEVFGRLDAAVASAAVIVDGQPLWDTPTDHLRTLLDIDVIGVWNTAAAVVPTCLPAPTSAAAGSSPSRPPEASKACSTSRDTARPSSRHRDREGGSRPI